MAIGDIEKRGRGRPRTNATPVMVRLPPEQLAQVDAWRAREGKRRGKSISRPEALRGMIEATIRMGGLGEDDDG